MLPRFLLTPGAQRGNASIINPTWSPAIIFQTFASFSTFKRVLLNHSMRLGLKRAVYNVSSKHGTFCTTHGNSGPSHIERMLSVPLLLVWENKLGTKFTTCLLERVFTCPLGTRGDNSVSTRYPTESVGWLHAMMFSLGYDGSTRRVSVER